MEPQVMVMIIATNLTFWGTVFGIAYLFFTSRNKERMALIEKGMDASIFKIEKESNNDLSLKWGLVAVTLGVGVFIGDFLGRIGLLSHAGAILSMLLLFGGGGLLAYYSIITKKNKTHSFE